MKLSQSKFNSLSPDSDLVHSYLIATVQTNKQPVRQSQQQALSAYCPNIYIVLQG